MGVASVAIAKRCHEHDVISVPAGERQTLGGQGTAELVERTWPHAVQPLQLGLAECSDLIEPRAANRKQRPARGCGQLGEIILWHSAFTSHGSFSVSGRFSAALFIPW